MTTRPVDQYTSLSPMLALESVCRCWKYIDCVVEGDRILNINLNAMSFRDIMKDSEGRH